MIRLLNIFQQLAVYNNKMLPNLSKWVQNYLINLENLPNLPHLIWSHCNLAKVSILFHQGAAF